MLEPRAPQYNKLIGGVRAAIDPIHLRNIKLGEPAVDDREHIGVIEQYATRTYVHGFCGRKSDVNGLLVRVKDGHHVGKTCFAPCCEDLPLLLLDCRIVYIDIRKPRWCPVDSVAFHPFKWPMDVRKAKSSVRTLSAKDLSAMYANPYSCFKYIGWKYPRGCTKHGVNHEVA